MLELLLAQAKARELARSALPDAPVAAHERVLRARARAAVASILDPGAHPRA